MFNYPIYTHTYTLHTHIRTSIPILPHTSVHAHIQCLSMVARRLDFSKEGAVNFLSRVGPVVEEPLGCHVRRPLGSFRF